MLTNKFAEVPLNATSAINEALASIERGDEYSWCFPLIRYLESLQTGKAFLWAVAAVGELAVEESDKTDVRQQWLAELLELHDAVDGPPVLLRRAREIWYDGDKRDDTQTAIAKLLEGLAALRSDNENGYQRCLAGGVGAIVGGVYIENAGLLQAVELFRRWTGQM